MALVAAFPTRPAQTRLLCRSPTEPLLHLFIVIFASYDLLSPELSTSSHVAQGALFRLCRNLNFSPNVAIKIFIVKSFKDFGFRMLIHKVAQGSIKVKTQFLMEIIYLEWSGVDQ